MSKLPLPVNMDSFRKKKSKGAMRMKPETYRGINIQFMKQIGTQNVDAYIKESPLHPAAMGYGKQEALDNAKTHIDKLLRGKKR